MPLFLLTMMLAAAPEQQAHFEDPHRVAKLSSAFPRLEAMLLDWVKQRRVPGAVLGVIVDGELLWLKTTGLRDVENGLAVERETRFRIASMTKSFTALAILQLRDAGKLTLDDPVTRYVPELAALRYPTTDSRPITIRDLLTHAQGFPEDNAWGDRQLAQTNETMDAWMRSGIPFSTSPGTAYEYSNYGYAILGRVIERVSGVPYDRYVRERILVPLGMRSSTFDLPADHAAWGYRWEEGRWKREPVLEHGSFGAMGGLWTTAPELARWVGFLMAAFPPRDESEREPIRRASAREMQQVWRASPVTLSRSSLEGPPLLSAGGYGYGLRVSATCLFPSVVSHTGGLPGYGSFMAWLPEYGVGMIGMTNLTYAAPTTLIHEALEVLHGTGGLQPRRVEPPAVLLQRQGEVIRLLQSWDSALARSIAADNLFLDRSEERRQEQQTEWMRRHGRCTAAGAIQAANALRGKWRMDCERGWLNVAITLAPTAPPLVQVMDVESVLPPPAAVTAQLNALLQLGRQWNAAKARRLTSATFDHAGLRRSLRLLATRGECSLAETVAGDGEQSVTVRLRCGQSDAQMRLIRDAKSGLLTSVTLAPMPGKRCAL